jgi:WD40 repeat protein
VGGGNLHGASIALLRSRPPLSLPEDLTMKPMLLMALSVAITVTASGSRVPADDNPKAVHLCWFPRFSPDGSQVLCAHGNWEQKEGGEARLFSTNSGEVQHVFVHPRGVRSVAWSSKGTMLVTGSFWNGIRGFDLKSHRELFYIEKTWSAENLRISSDDKLLVVAFAIGDIRLYDLATRKETHLFFAAHDGAIWGMTLSPNDALVASGGKDNYANVFDLKTKKKVQSFKHPGEVNGVAFTPDNKYLVTGCSDKQIRAYDVATGELMGTYGGHIRGAVTDLQFTSDGKFLASAGVDGTVRIWDSSDLKNLTLKKTLKDHNNGVHGVAISPDDRYLVSAGWDEQVKMWDFKTGELLWTWKRK